MKRFKISKIFDLNCKLHCYVALDFANSKASRVFPLAVCGSCARVGQDLTGIVACYCVFLENYN